MSRQGASPEQEAPPRVTGTVEDVIYHSTTSDYTVIELVDDKTGQLVCAVGAMPHVAAGAQVRLWGDFTTHPDYGPQLAVSHYEMVLPTTEADILRYLSSKAVQGIGPSTALKIVNKFGKDTFEVMEQHPEWLADIPGITRKKAAAIHKSFMEMSELRSLMTLCAGRIGAAAVHRIYRMWGANATGYIRRDPYRLCRDVYGVSFARADELARELGVSDRDGSRIEAGLHYVLQNAAQMGGHTCLPREMLVREAEELLSLDRTLVEEAVESAVKRGEIVPYARGEMELCFSRTLSDCEATVAAELVRIRDGAVTWGISNLHAMVDRAEQALHIKYAPLQRKAIIEAFESGVTVITGGPGTGKTTLIHAMLYLFNELGVKTVLAAPTGRAANRMSEATAHEAKTIHRLLEMERTETDEPRFRRDREAPLDEMVVIADEASMIDLPLMAALVRAMRRGARLILVGDSDQLPSVGCGNILHDLIESGVFPVVRLTEIFRQSQNSYIVTNAHLIHQGKLPECNREGGDFFYLPREREEQIAATVEELVKRRLPKAYGASFLRGLQIVTPTRRGPAGTEMLNVTLQACLNPPASSKKEIQAHGVIFREGDKVMQIRNHYELEWKKGDFSGSGIMNGEMGEILEISKEEEHLTVSFDGRETEYEFSMLDELEHAYAITVHKSQGSEYPAILLPLSYAGPMLQTRNLLYTAVTRARRMVILVGRGDVLRSMVENDRETARYTCLIERLRER